MAETPLTSLRFRRTHRFRPVQLVADGFEVDTSATTNRQGLHVLADSPPAPYVAIELTVTGTEGPVCAGLVCSGPVCSGVVAEDQHVLVTWDPASSRISISVRRAGRTRVLRRRKVALTAPFGLAFALCENQVTALVDTGSGWHPVVSERGRVAALLDLRDEVTLAEHTYAWGGTDVEPSSVRAGLFGMVGLRDPHLVQHADGSPYLLDGRLWFTWTCAGLGFFQQAHWSVWSMDPADPAGMRLESHLFSRRDGLVLGDHAGQLVRDGERWLLATSSWGDFEPGSIHVRHTESGEDLLHGVHVLDTVRTPLPTTYGTWDPALTRVDGTWHVAYVESPSQRPFRFRPALAATTADTWHTALTEVARLGNLGQCEGPIMVRTGGGTWLLTSDGQRHVYAIFDLTGSQVGQLDAPYVTNIPHPQLVPDPAGGWMLVTFDGTGFERSLLGYGGHGDVVVMHS
ncbi:hypothetical protein [Nocardioides sp.]|uniref:hypothetical protein n=1 Tax=Nocardioides sp. TaxID=35761 RepID=UPI0035681D8F